MSIEYGSTITTVIVDHNIFSTQTSRVVMVFRTGGTTTIVTLISQILFCLVLNVLSLILADTIKVICSIFAGTHAHVPANQSALCAASDRPDYTLLLPQVL